MLTLVDKALLEKFHNLSQESAAETLQSFPIEKKMYKEWIPITPAGKFPYTTLRRNRKCAGLASQSAPRLSDVRTSSAVSQMNTLKEKPTSKLPVPVCSGRARNCSKDGYTVNFVISHPSWCVTIDLYKMQLLQQLLSDDAAKQKLFTKWALSGIEQNPQWLLSILWIEEDNFSLYRTVNTHNCRNWAEENLHS